MRHTIETLTLGLLVAVGLGAAELQSSIAAGNLVYAGNKTSKCFSNDFLREVEVDTGIPTQKDFVKVRLDDTAALQNHPFVLMNGEGDFTLTATERVNLRDYLGHGGFLLASAGCSSSSWAASMRRELIEVFGRDAVHRVETDHPIFHTLNDLDRVPTGDGKQAAFEGVTIDGRLAVLFSPEGLNNTAKVKGCCCCGGDEVKAASKVVANALIYSLVE